MAAGERSLNTELEGLLSRPNAHKGLEAFISSHEGKTLPGCHALIIRAKQILALAKDDAMTKAKAKRKIELCRQVLEVLQVLEPGLATRVGEEIVNRCTLELPDFVFCQLDVRKRLDLAHWDLCQESLIDKQATYMHNIEFAHRHFASALSSF